MPTPCRVAGNSSGIPLLARISAETDNNSVWAGEEVDVGSTPQVWSASPPQRSSSSSYNQHPVLLQVSDDASLATTRQALLRIAGFDVHTCGSTDVSCLREELARRLAAAVFCQSIEAETALFLCHFLSGKDHSIATVRISRRPWQEQDSNAYSLVLQAPLAPVEFVSTMMQLRVKSRTPDTVE